MTTAVHKMSRAELAAELNSYPMEALGTIRDLRESVILAREICKMFQGKRLARLFNVTHLAPNDYSVDKFITGDYSDRVHEFIVQNKLLDGDVIFVGTKNPEKQDRGFAVVMADGSFSTKEAFHVETCDYDHMTEEINQLWLKHFGKKAC